MTPTTNAVLIDLSVKSGTANILNQRQWNRKCYEGEKLCECKMNLQSNESVSDEVSTKYKLLTLMTSQPLKVIFVDSDNNTHKLNVTSNFIYDGEFSCLVITNISEETAVISMTKLC